MFLKNLFSNILSHFFDLSLRRIHHKNLIFYSGDFKEKMLSNITTSFFSHFGERDFLELHIIPGRSASSHRDHKSDILFSPEMFNEFDPKDYWRVLTKVISLSVELNLYENSEATEHYKKRVVNSKLLDHNSEIKALHHEQLFLEYIKAKKFNKIIDIGCGAGAIYPYLIKEASISHYSGYDYSRIQIDNALKLYHKADFNHFFYGLQINFFILTENI